MRPAKKSTTSPRRGGRGKCLACASGRHAEIDAALTAGESIRDLGRRFEISPTALRSHKRDHLSPALIAVGRATSPSVVGLVDRLRGLVEDAEAVLSAALMDGNGSQALAAIREMRATLELVGRATGELKDRPAVSLNLQTSPEWISIRTVMVELLAPHPDLGRQLARKLKTIDGGDG